MASTIKELDHLRIPLEEIINATNNFADENIIGKGGLGNVYKGQLMRSGKSLNVSVRRFDGRKGNVEFLTEVYVLSSLKNHNHIVSMIGFCEEKREKIIINSYQANGSLMMHLSNPVSFTWLQRMKLAVQVAKAISYLHSGTMDRAIEDLASICLQGLDDSEEDLPWPFISNEKPFDDYVIIHRNISSFTILLDENMIPRLSGFEYSIQHPMDQKTDAHLCEVIWTHGYMDPMAVKYGAAGLKSDVYSFGVVLFEILCGRKAYQDNKLLVPLARFHYEQGTLQDIILPDLWKQMDSKSFKVFSEIAYSCLEPEWTRRPDIDQVLDELMKAMGHDAIGQEEKLPDVRSVISNHNREIDHKKQKKILEDHKKALPNYQKNVENKIATWEEQLIWCIDKANELNDLHNEMEVQKTLIHDDQTNSGTISLDDNNVGAKIDRYRNSVFHSEAYKDPEFFETGLLCKESDIFGFGVLMAEIIWGGNVDIKLLQNKGYNEGSVNSFLHILSECVTKRRNERPTMKVVIQELQDALAHQKNHKRNFRMSYEDIKSATQNFSLANVIGGGGFGKVYKGELADTDGNGGYIPIVAKKLDTRHGQGDKEFYNELYLLREYKHENIIGLVGYSNETDERIIVYEHASKGSLDKYLSDATLTWRNRLKICIDFARGLDFLHGGDHAVIHRDIKSSNILLFDDWKAKVGDLGLSMLSATSSYSVDIACGTEGYVDPLYLKSGLLTKESDIYSFGVVLCEILCGKAIYEIHKFKTQSLLSFIQHSFEEGKQDDLVFKAINEEIVPDSLAIFLDIIYRCLHEDRETRPSSKEVLRHLKRALYFQEEGVNLIMSLDDIKFATQNFNPANEIERGDFWSVYKGEFAKEEGEHRYTVVAKKFDTIGKKQYYDELQIVYGYKHENIISLVGYINQMDEKILVYEHASKGSIDKYLSDASLAWMDRLKICIDFAIGLNFLHEGSNGKEKVIHRDIKSSNILLFDDWKVKIDGFGLSSKISKNTNYTTIDPASGYVDPIYLTSGMLTIESDIYSVGVVLFEILFGKVVYEINKHESESLLSFIKHNFEKGKQGDIVFEGIKEEIAPKSLTTFLNILCQCLDDDPEKRPSSKEVLQQLRWAFQFQEDYDLGCCLGFVKWFC